MTPIVTFFSSRAGVGTTSLVYHLAWMYAQHGARVLAVDLDPQVGLTMKFLSEEQVLDVWTRERNRTGPGAIHAALESTASVDVPDLEAVAPGLFFLPGLPVLAALEDDFADAWIRLGDQDASTSGALTSLQRVVEQAATAVAAEVVLIDLGSGLSALNRAALIASDHVVLPLLADVLSGASIELVGLWMKGTRTRWASFRPTGGGAAVPEGKVAPRGYVLTFGGRSLRPGFWERAIPREYATHVQGTSRSAGDLSDDTNCLGLVKDFRSLVALASAARKPVFMLGPADGALGSHAAAVHQAYADYEQLADRVAAATWRRLPTP